MVIATKSRYYLIGSTPNYGFPLLSDTMAERNGLPGRGKMIAWTDFLAPYVKADGSIV